MVTKYHRVVVRVLCGYIISHNITESLYGLQNITESLYGLQNMSIV